MNPIIKWPGGKSREIVQIEHLIPVHRRYIEPFFGGGALYFHLEPEQAAINDISPALIQYYRLIQRQDPQLYALLQCYSRSFQTLVTVCGQEGEGLLALFDSLRQGELSEGALGAELGRRVSALTPRLGPDFARQLLLDRDAFEAEVCRMAKDKFLRTVANDRRSPFDRQDLQDNLVTGFASGYYMYFRKVFNDISLGRLTSLSEAYRSANFYFIREYCYGSMFRYNAQGEFNIPYGGMSYNRKDMQAKIGNMFNPEIERLMAHTQIHCSDFEAFLQAVEPTEEDFLFLDPPYDTDFSDYEGRDFTHSDQARLARVLRETRAKLILVIKNTAFIRSLYEEHFRILSFDRQYAYNVRSRNNRGVEHLIITNIPSSPATL